MAIASLLTVHSNLFALLAVNCSLLTLTSCSSDHDVNSNPQIATPQDFTLNTPSYAGFPVDLARTDSMSITWSQPQYTAGENIPLNLSYEILASLNDNFNVALDSADNDMSGKLVADYAAMARTTTKCSYNIVNDELDSLIMRLGNYQTMAEVPNTIPVYLRVNAFINENDSRLHEKQSNSVQIQTIPFYKEIKFLDPISWYIIGYGIGSTAWGMVPAIKQNIIPTFLIPGEKYNKVKGTGITEYTDYFYKGQKFRFLLTPGVWDQKHGYEQLKEQDDPTYYSFVEEGTDNNFVVKKSGCYTITMNTATNIIDMEPYDGTVTKYTSLTTQGTVNGSAAAVIMDPVNINGNSTVEDATDADQKVENHIWCCTVKGGDAFKIIGDGGKAWGYVNGLKASTDDNGNIVIPDGTYLFFFNDINGYYMLIKQ